MENQNIQILDVPIEIKDVKEIVEVKEVKEIKEVKGVKEVKAEKQKENYDIIGILATIKEEKICIKNKRILFYDLF